MAIGPKADSGTVPRKDQTRRLGEDYGKPAEDQPCEDGAAADPADEGQPEQRREHLRCKRQDKACKDRRGDGGKGCKCRHRQERNRQRDAGDELLRVQQRPPGLASVSDATPGNDKLVFTYHPTGWAKAAAQTLLLSPDGKGAAARVVCISNQGRPTLRPEGMAQCS